jgi:hypothetical protein
MKSITLEKEKEEIFKSIDALESIINGESFHLLKEEDKNELKLKKKELEDKHYQMTVELDNNRLEELVDEEFDLQDSTSIIEVENYDYNKDYMIRKSRHDLKLSYARLRQKDLSNDIFGAVEYVYYLHTKNKNHKLSWKKILAIVSKRYNIPVETIRSEWSRRINYMRYAEKNLLL